MNRKQVRAFAAHARNLSEMERFEAAKIVAERALGGPFGAEEDALSAAIVELSAGRPWFHGGLPGRRPGDELLPASVTGADPRSCAAEILDRSSYVYLTQSRAVALDYAEAAKGLVYRVRPIGPVIVDPTELRTWILVAKAFGPKKEIEQAGPLWVAQQMFGSVKGYACKRAVVLD
jgi:hypothetical protein